MRYRGLRIAGYLLMLLMVIVPARGNDDSTVSLFDGKSLAGWTPEHSRRFKVSDGLLVGEGGAGWLRSNSSLRNFELTVEYRAVEACSTGGIFFRAKPESTPKEPHLPTLGYQLQLSNSEDHLRVFGHGTPPPTSDRKTMELKRAAKGAGEWQSIRLRVVGSRLEVHFNDVLITVSDAVILPEGHLGLQVEQGRIEWRSLKLKDLPNQPN